MKFPNPLTKRSSQSLDFDAQSSNSADTISSDLPSSAQDLLRSSIKDSSSSLDQAIKAAKNAAEYSSDKSTIASSSDSSNSSSSSNSSDTSKPPSAQEIINARYQPQPAPKSNAPKAAASARAAINATQVAPDPTQTPKSAARLHRGFIKRSMESTRTSASALMKPAGGEPRNVPKVHTSLKLGANSRPKKPPVTLPPNARMARAAYATDISGAPVKVRRRPAKQPGRAQSLERRSVNAQVVLPSPAALPGQAVMSPQPQPQPQAGRQIPINITHDAGSLPPNPSSPAHSPRSITVFDVNDQATIPSSSLNAPIAHTLAPVLAQAQDPAAISSQPTPPIAPQPKPLSRPRHVTIQDYSATQPPVTSDTATAPVSQSRPSSVARPAPRAQAASVGLGVVEDYAPTPYPPRPQDSTPPGVNARNLKNPNVHKAVDSRNTLGKQSPFFLKSVNVEKRPLSHETGGTGQVVPRASLHRVETVNPTAPPVKSKPKSSKFGTIRNRSRKHADTGPSDDYLSPLNRTMPERPTVIVPSGHRSNAPLFFLIVITIILGTAVGAAAYLCFFQ